MLKSGVCQIHPVFFILMHESSDTTLRLGVIPLTPVLELELIPSMSGFIGSYVQYWNTQTRFSRYALKMYVMTGEDQYLDVWNEAYGPIMKYSRGSEGFWVSNCVPPRRNRL